MGGGGKAESLPWRGPAGAQRPPHGGRYSALGTRGQSPWRSHTIRRTEASASLSRAAAQERRPRNGATRSAAWRRAERRARPLRHRRSAADRSEREAAARPARREARAPAGQHEDAAPSGARSAGERASLETPAHFTAALPPYASDRHRRPRRRRRLGAAIRADGIAE